MKKILTSWWFSLVIGVLVFVGVVALMWHPPPAVDAAKPEAGAEAKEAGAGGHELDAVEKILTPTNAPLPSSSTAPAAAIEVGSPGELRFNNPEVSDLIKELKSRNAALADQQKELNALRDRLKLELQTIAITTQTVSQAILDFQKAQSNKVILTSRSDDSKYRGVANMFTNMQPASAVIILDGQPIEEVVQILQRMTDAQKAGILEQFAKNTNNAAKAVQISAALLRLADKSQNP